MPVVSDGARRVCEHCGAPLRELVDGLCPFCKTRPLAGSGPAAATSFTVVLLDAGDAKIQVIKELRELVQPTSGPTSV